MKLTGLKDANDKEIKHGDYLTDFFICDGTDCCGDEPCEDCQGHDNALYRMMYRPEYARFYLEEMEDCETLTFEHPIENNIGIEHDVIDGVLQGFMVVGNVETHDLIYDDSKDTVHLTEKIKVKNED